MPLNIRQYTRRVWIPSTKPERPGQFSISLNWISWPFIYGCVSHVDWAAVWAAALLSCYLGKEVAEEEGFEPPVDLRPRLISSQVP